MSDICVQRRQETLDTKALKGIFLGYSSGSNCYIVYADDASALKGHNEMWTSRNVTVNQNCSPQAKPGYGSLLQDAGAMEFGDDGEEILTVI